MNTPLPPFVKVVAALSGRLIWPDCRRQGAHRGAPLHFLLNEMDNPPSPPFNKGGLGGFGIVL